MADILSDVEHDGENKSRLSRPSLAQVKAIIDFMQKYPNLANKKVRSGISQEKFRRLWTQLADKANSIEGAVKSTKGWIKFWSDKKRSLKLKQRQIEEGKLRDKLTPLERTILDLSLNDKSSGHRKKKSVKEEPCNGNDDDDSLDEEFLKDSDELEFSQADTSRLLTTETDERQMDIMEKLVEMMGQQASAMSQMAQASLSNSKALERLAEASHIQALAVDRLANTFENITASVHEVRNAIMSIDYTMKRCYSATTTQHRQNTNIFS